MTSTVGSRLDRRADAGGDRTTAWCLVGITSLVVAVTVGYAVAGPGYVLDDWVTLRNAHFHGVWEVAGPDQRVARPGAWVTYAVVFGVIGRNPMPVLLLQGTIGAVTAVLWFLTLRRLVPAQLALLAAVLWVVLPNHTSLEVWASASNIALSVMLLVAGCLVLTSPRLDTRRVVLVGVLFASSVLCYEATLPAAAMAAVVLPRLAGGRFRMDAVIGAGVGLAAAFGWIVTHWHPAKQVSGEVADLSQVLGAHLGWGIAPEGPLADVLLLVGLLGVGAAAARVALPSLRASAGVEEHVVVAGVAIVVLGTMPFALYLYAPLGAGDRFNAVSSLGGALVWAGVLGLAARVRRELAVVGVAALLVAAAVARVERADRWHRAGADALAILDGVQRAIPEPSGTVVIGPTPIQEGNVAAFLDQSNIDAAVQLVYDDPTVRGGITFTREQFESIPVERRFDIRAVSQLEGDAAPAAG